MPFQTTSNVPPMDSIITIAFSGLMVLRPGAGNTCEVGIHKFNTSHECRVTLIIRRPGCPATLVPLLKGPLEGPFSISRKPDPNPVMDDFAVFAPTPDPFNRNDQNNHENDFRWAVNINEIPALSGFDFNEGAHPLVTLKTGILYTLNRTRQGINPQFVNRNVNPPRVHPLHSIASNLAAAITPDSKVLLKWRDFGNEKEFELPRKNNHDPAGTRYTVMFTNEPSKIFAEPHDEMALYYRILRNGGAGVLSNQQLRIEYAPGAMTDEVPCLSLTRHP